MPVILHSPRIAPLTLAELARWQSVPVAVAVDLGRDAGHNPLPERPE